MMTRVVVLAASLVVLCSPVSADAASKRACKRACQAEIADCLRACGAFGDMRSFQRSCKRAVIQRCKDEGVAVCGEGAQPATTTTLAPIMATTTTTIVPLPCSDTAPGCNGSCPAGQACSANAGGCLCAPRFRACASSVPVCNGECAPGLACEDIRGACVCVASRAFPTTSTTMTVVSTTSTSSTTTTTQPSRCFDGIRNQDETAVDCGGSICLKRCTGNQSCLISDDCDVGFSCFNDECL